MYGYKCSKTFVQKNTQNWQKKRGATNFTQADIQFQQFSIHKIYIIMHEQLSELHCNFSAIPKKGIRSRKTRDKSV